MIVLMKGLLFFRNYCRSSVRTGIPPEIIVVILVCSSKTLVLRNLLLFLWKDCYSIDGISPSLTKALLNLYNSFTNPNTSLSRKCFCVVENV